MKLAVIDLGLGNLASVCGALEDVGAAVDVIDHGSKLAHAAAVLPGVGSYAAGSAALVDREFMGAIPQRARDGMHVLGICLGMQLMGTNGEEGAEWHPELELFAAPGLGLFAASCHRLQHDHLPHMGWSRVGWRRNTYPAGTYYFAHSYALEFWDDTCDEASSILGERTFTAGMIRSRCTGVQFHPEKSQRAGAEFLRRWFATAL
ncbi:MAG TPA: imidazole glycerol phosphate synthase subunit HisH [Candidatus Rokubacteria bacterium]|nr:imidazole glycerol phosphate synthase subunit HisH [Candidatus Rokubacteria bacterium]